MLETIPSRAADYSTHACWLGHLAAIGVAFCQRLGAAWAAAGIRAKIEPYIETREEGMRYFWQAISAAYVGVGAPPLQAPPAHTPVPWARTLQLALPSLDEHDLELVDIAREEGAFYRDPIYERAAARRLGLVS